MRHKIDKNPTQKGTKRHEYDTNTTQNDTNNEDNNERNRQRNDWNQTQNDTNATLMRHKIDENPTQKRHQKTNYYDTNTKQNVTKRH